MAPVATCDEVAPRLKSAEVGTPLQKKLKPEERSVDFLQAIVDDWTEGRIQNDRQEYGKQADRGFTPWQPSSKPNFKKGSLTSAFSYVFANRTPSLSLEEELITWCVQHQRRDAINAWFSAIVNGICDRSVGDAVASSLLKLAARKGAVLSGSQEWLAWYVLAGGRGQSGASPDYPGNADLVDILMTNFPPRRGDIIERRFEEREQGFASQESAALFARTAMWLKSYNRSRAAVREPCMSIGL